VEDENGFAARALGFDLGACTSGLFLAEVNLGLGVGAYRKPEPTLLLLNQVAFTPVGIVAPEGMRRTDYSVNMRVMRIDPRVTSSHEGANLKGGIGLLEAPREGRQNEGIP
jgi:hypothetical protein